MLKLFSLVALSFLPAAVFAAPTLADSLAARAGGPEVYSIHPGNDTTKCIGIKGGQYADGAQVDVYDCNDSNTQHWQWYGNALTSVNVQDLKHWCLDAGNVSELKNGVKAKIWTCFDTLPQQNWTVQKGPEKVLHLSVGNKCLDLTDGVKTNGNVLQIWDCVNGDANQHWSFTPS